MIKLEYSIKNEKLGYIDPDKKSGDIDVWVECTSKELTKIIVNQEKNKAELSDDYIEKVAEAMKEAASVSIDYRYEVAKSTLAGLIDSYIVNDYTYSKEMREDLTIEAVTASFRYADEFIKQGGYKNK